MCIVNLVLRFLTHIILAPTVASPSLYNLTFAVLYFGCNIFNELLFTTLL